MSHAVGVYNSQKFSEKTRQMTALAIINKSTSDVDDDKKYALVDTLISTAVNLESTIQELVEDDEKFQKMRACVEQVYPDISNFKLEDILDEKEIDLTIDESILEAEIEVLGVNVTSLVDNPEFYERLSTFLDREYPEFGLDRDFRYEFLEGTWAEEISAAIDNCDKS